MPVAEYGNQLIVGGSEHDLQFYDRNRTLKGVFAAARQRGMTDAFATFYSQVGIAVPNFWLGLLMKRFYREQLAPIGNGMSSRFTQLTPSEQDRVLASLEETFPQMKWNAANAGFA